MNVYETIMVIDESRWCVWTYKCSKKKRNMQIRSCWCMLKIFWNKKLWHRKWQFSIPLVYKKKNNDKNETYSNCKCMMVPTTLYMVSIKSSRLSEPYVPIKWLPLVNSWSLWNYTLTDIFNCSISTTISLNIASKGQLTTSQLLHWLQSVTSHHLN